MKTTYRTLVPYVTRDGSEVRELMHPALHANRNQSLAEATVPAGSATRLHLHRRAEEIYHIVAGDGTMRLGQEEFPIAAGDTILIAPGTPHCVTNTGTEALRILCACAPAYSHEDTDLLD
jgi:mannose-6-phosphate isomerase-like protein (cupin superfamily)